MKPLRSVLFVAVATLGLSVSSVGAAQESGGTMTFGEDASKDVEKKQGQSTGEQASGQQPVVGTVAVPTKAITASQRSQLQKELEKQMGNVPDIQLDKSTAVLDALKKRTVKTCVTEPLCLGAVGEEVKVDRIMLARVKKRKGKFRIDLDYFQVGERLFTKYRSDDELGSFSAVVEQVGPLVKDMFGLEKRKEPEYAEQDSGKTNMIIAISSSVLTAGSIAGGTVIGNQASSSLKKLSNLSKNDKGYYEDMTQREAKQQLEDAKSKAQTANIFYGLAGAFGVTSGIMFIVDATSGGSKKGKKKKSARGAPRLDVTPTAGPSGIGFSADVQF